MPRPPVKATNALYIKLGASSEWEKECVANGTLRLGYRELPDQLCRTTDWSAAELHALTFAKDKGAATRHINQVRNFYEAPASTLWVTFHSDRLWWCFARKPVELQADKTKLRRTLNGWHDRDVNEKPLLKATLSGKLLATESFQGTICTIAERAYLLHKINGTSEPHVVAAQLALQQLVDSLVPIIKKLHPKDLEVLTDLIFRQSGWSRTGVAGGTTKDIDLDLLSPLTGERIAVQVKSHASTNEYEAYRSKFSDMQGYSRFYFVTHTPNAALETLAAVAADSSFVFWGATELAAHAARGGLAGWLLDKAS